jgi:fatty acid desaturase
MIAVAALGPIVLVALFQLDGEAFFYLIILSITVWMVWVIYSINLSQLESEEEIKKIHERRETMISNMVKNQD